jgi:hypothetical protein
MAAKTSSQDGHKITQQLIRLEDRDIDMNETLSFKFQKSNGTPLEIDGQIVQQILCVAIPETKKNFLIQRLKSKEKPVSGLRLKAVNGEIEVNGERYSDIILWADTSPDAVSVSVLSKSGCELKAWNVWMIEGIVQAWVGNSGMIVTEEGKSTRLECSDGSGNVDFSDFVVTLHA